MRFPPSSSGLFSLVRLFSKRASPARHSGDHASGPTKKRASVPWYSEALRLPCETTAEARHKARLARCRLAKFLRFQNTTFFCKNMQKPKCLAARSGRLIGNSPERHLHPALFPPPPSSPKTADSHRRCFAGRSPGRPFPRAALFAPPTSPKTAPLPPSFPPLSRHPRFAGRSPGRPLPLPVQPKLPPAFPAPQSRCRREGCPIQAFPVGRGVPAEPFFLVLRFLVPARRGWLAPSPKGLTRSFGRALYQAWKPDYDQFLGF